MIRYLSNTEFNDKFLRCINIECKFPIVEFHVTMKIFCVSEINSEKNSVFPPVILTSKSSLTKSLLVGGWSSRVKESVPRAIPSSFAVLPSLASVTLALFVSSATSNEIEGFLRFSLRSC